MTMILRERVRQPGRYGEVEEEHLPSPAKFVHETVPFNPNLPPARFPTLDHPPPKHSETTKGLYQGKEILTVANANMTDVNIMALTEKKSNGPKGSMKSTPPRSTGSDQHSMILGPISIPDEDLELRFEEIDKRPKTFHSERKAPSSTAPQRDQNMDRQELYEIHHRAPSRPYAATDNEYDLMHFPSTEFHPEDMVGLRTGLTAYELVAKWSHLSDGIKIVIFQELSTVTTATNTFSLLGLNEYDISEFYEINEREASRQKEEDHMILASQARQLELLRQGPVDREAFSALLEEDLYANLSAPATFMITKNDIRNAKSFLRSRGLDKYAGKISEYYGTDINVSAAINRKDQAIARADQRDIEDEDELNGGEAVFDDMWAKEELLVNKFTIQTGDKRKRTLRPEEGSHGNAPPTKKPQLAKAALVHPQLTFKLKAPLSRLRESITAEHIERSAAILDNRSRESSADPLGADHLNFSEKMGELYGGKYKEMSQTLRNPLYDTSLKMVPALGKGLQTKKESKKEAPVVDPQMFLPRPSIKSCSGKGTNARQGSLSVQGMNQGEDYDDVFVLTKKKPSGRRKKVIRKEETMQLAATVDTDTKNLDKKSSNMANQAKGSRAGYKRENSNVTLAKMGADGEVHILPSSTQPTKPGKKNDTIRRNSKTELAADGTSDTAAKDDSSVMPLSRVSAPVNNRRVSAAPASREGNMVQKRLMVEQVVEPFNSTPLEGRIAPTAHGLGHSTLASPQNLSMACEIMSSQGITIPTFKTPFNSQSHLADDHDITILEKGDRQNWKENMQDLFPGHERSNGRLYAQSQLSVDKLAPKSRPDNFIQDISKFPNSPSLPLPAGNIMGEHSSTSFPNIKSTKNGTGQDAGSTHLDSLFTQDGQKCAEPLDAPTHALVQIVVKHTAPIIANKKKKLASENAQQTPKPLKRNGQPYIRGPYKSKRNTENSAGEKDFKSSQKMGSKTSDAHVGRSNIVGAIMAGSNMTQMNSPSSPEKFPMISSISIGFTNQTLEIERNKNTTSKMKDRTSLSASASRHTPKLPEQTQTYNNREDRKAEMEDKKYKTLLNSSTLKTDVPDIFATAECCQNLTAKVHKSKTTCFTQPTFSANEGSIATSEGDRDKKQAVIEHQEIPGIMREVSKISSCTSLSIAKRSTPLLQLMSTEFGKETAKAAKELQEDSARRAESTKTIPILESLRTNSTQSSSEQPIQITQWEKVEVVENKSEDPSKIGERANSTPSERLLRCKTVPFTSMISLMPSKNAAKEDTITKEKPVSCPDWTETAPLRSKAPQKQPKRVNAAVPGLSSKVVNHDNKISTRRTSVKMEVAAHHSKRQTRQSSADFVAKMEGKVGYKENVHIS